MLFKGSGTEASSGSFSSSSEGTTASATLSVFESLCANSVGGGHLDCEAALPAADRLLVGLPLMWPAGLRHIDVLLSAEALP